MGFKVYKLLFFKLLKCIQMYKCETQGTMNKDILLTYKK